MFKETFQQSIEEAQGLFFKGSNRSCGQLSLQWRPLAAGTADVSDAVMPKLIENVSTESARLGLAYFLVDFFELNHM
jgi:hypothetical protein